MTPDETAPRLITLKDFWHGMLGFTNRAYYYDHKNDPGFPQPVKLPGELRGKPMLVREECEAYVDALIAKRDAKKKGG